MQIKGPWDRRQIDAHLEATVIPIRLANVTASGWPLVVSLWYLYDEGKLCCASRPGARIVRLLREEPRCAFEIARDQPPYFGVRGRGRAVLRQGDGERLLTRLISRYLGPADTPLRRELLGNAADEVSIEIEPERLSSWDFRSRMGPGKR